MCAESDTKLQQLIAHYMSAVEANRPIDRDQILRQNPDCCKGLMAFFSKLDQQTGGVSVAGLNGPNDISPDDEMTIQRAETVIPTPAQADGTSPQDVERFGNYELLSMVAHGGMGMVYKARDVKLKRTVALKMILAGKFACDEQITRFHSEAEAAGKLDHPGIVPVFEVGQCEGQHFYSMAFVDGESLGQRLRAGPLQPVQAAKYASSIAAAISYAHEHGVIHRDLKPANILLDKMDQPRIVDFGLAKHLADDSGLTATDTIMGTPSYMSPEQAAGRASQVSGLTDVYSVGAILYAMLIGNPPFVGASSTDTLIQVLEEEPVPPRRIVPGISRDLEAICLKCLEKNPLERYQSAKDLEADLNRFLKGDPIRARSDWRRRFIHWTLREPVLAAHLATILFLMMVVAAIHFTFGYVQFSKQNLWMNQAILVSWAAVAFVLQKIHNVLPNKEFIPRLWAAVNPVIMSAVIWVNHEAPRAELLSMYLMLIVITSLFRRVAMIAIATVSSLLGFLVIALKFSANDPSLGAPSYHFVFGLTLVVTGVLLGIQVHRINRTRQTDHKSGSP